MKHANNKVISYCKRCGRPLTTYKSIRRGYGDECAKKVEKEMIRRNSLARVK